MGYWIHLHKIKDRNFWELPCRGKMSWAWRKVLQLRPFIRKFVWHSIGDGTRTSIWYDQWCSLSLLADFISTRDMFRAGLSTTSKVPDVMGTNSLEWPRELQVKYPSLLSILTPRLLIGSQDKLEWKSRSDTIKPFAVNTIWHSIRPRDEKDRLSSWDVNGSLVRGYSLCESQPDSHEHLFFECSFAMQVWRHMRDLVGLSHLPRSFEVILDFVTPMAKRRTSSSVVSKLVLVASVYFIWLERNDRLFNNNKRTVAQVIECIMSAIRLKLMSCRFKKSKVNLDLMKHWKLPEMLICNVFVVWFLFVHR
nr:hypothetical protein [Tanacetum cinerariifolium]